MERLTDKKMKGEGFISVDPKEYKAFIRNEKPSGKQIYQRLLEIEDIIGDEYELDRLRELVEADRDGRCAVFPCKPSDVTLHQLRSKQHPLGAGVSPRHVYCATVWSGGHYQLEHQGFDPCRDRDFGKTWFLDEESANAALKGEQDGVH